MMHYADSRVGQALGKHIVCKLFAGPRLLTFSFLLCVHLNDCLSFQQNYLRIIVRRETALAVLY